MKMKPGGFLPVSVLFLGWSTLCQADLCCKTTISDSIENLSFENVCEKVSDSLLYTFIYSKNSLFRNYRTYVATILARMAARV